MKSYIIKFVIFYLFYVYTEAEEITNTTGIIDEIEKCYCYNISSSKKSQKNGKLSKKSNSKGKGSKGMRIR